MFLRDRMPIYAIKPYSFADWLGYFEALLQCFSGLLSREETVRQTAGQREVHIDIGKRSQNLGSTDPRTKDQAVAAAASKNSCLTSVSSAHCD
jgi:hypothetical protein